MDRIGGACGIVEFIDEASKLITDALTHELDDLPKFITPEGKSGLLNSVIIAPSHVA
jgi:hypothetical protein